MAQARGPASLYANLSPRKRPHSQCLEIYPEEDDAPAYRATLESPNFSNHILEGMCDLRAKDMLCDYTITAEGCSMRVHRAVMVACSDYFRALLSSEMRESLEMSVELKGLTATGLQSVVNFAYTGKIDLSLENLEEVLAAATHLQISQAVELCCKFIARAITVDNCTDILNLAELYSLMPTREVGRNFILNNFELFSKSEQYEKLNCNQLASMLAENSLKVVSEYVLFELVLKWINQDPPEREQYVSRLMSQIRLPLLSGEELVEKVSKVEVMMQDEQCVQLLTEAKDYHIVVNKQPLLQNPRTQVRSDKESLVMCHAENLESYDFETEKHAYLKDCPVPLYNPCVCVVDNFMYACGGKYDSNDNNEIATARCFRYDPRFDSWFELASMSEARKDFVLLAYNMQLYAIGGQDENNVMCSLECFNIAMNEWETRSSLKNAIYSHAGAIGRDRMYICGGQQFDGHCNTVLSYSPKEDTWQDEPPLCFARSNHSLLAVKDSLYVIGGNIDDQYGFSISVTAIEKLSLDTKQWTICTSTLNIREAGACVLNNRIYIVGGINGEHYYSDLVQCYSPETDSIELTDRFLTRIFGHACCILSLPQCV